MDFVSQASLETHPDLPQDCLGHEGIGRSILERAAILPAGSMISVQGPWGRGKTDVLARVAAASFTETPAHSIFLPAIWINPWQYGTPDLLSPVVIALLKRIKPAHRTGKKALWKAAESIIKAGLSFGLKATALTVPGGQIYEAAAKEAKSLLEGLFEARELDDDSTPDPDPVSEMGHRFAELVQQLITHENRESTARLLICVDDLDRCLPHRQVALLEALRFLVSAGASATVLVALDPTLARQSVIAHYGTSAFDPDRYLDKMFDLRLTLPSISEDMLRTLIQRQIDLGRESAFPGQLGLFADLEDAAVDALFLPEFRNPRMLSRIFSRFHLLARSGLPPDLKVGKDDKWLWVLWLALIERRPELRAALQDAGSRMTGRFEDIFKAYGSVFDPDLATPAERKHLANYMRGIGMPDPDEAPDLTGVFQWIVGHRPSHRADKVRENMEQVGKIFSDLDRVLVQAGL